MALFNKKGRREFLSVEEVKETITTYLEFDAYRKSFSKNPKTYASIVLNYIKVMENWLPPEIRLSLPDYLKLHTKDLNELEKECKKHINS